MSADQQNALATAIDAFHMQDQLAQNAGSKKEARKAAAAEKLAAEQASRAQAEAENDHARHLYGALPTATKSATTYTHISRLVESPADHLDKKVTVRAFLHGVRGTSKNAFLMLRQTIHMMQAIASIDDPVLSRPMVKWIGSIPKESLVEVHGRLVSADIKSESMSLKTAELHVESLYVVHEASGKPPFNLDDAARPEDGPENLPRVLLDTRLNSRAFDLKTCTNQAIFVIQGGVVELFSEFLRARSFRQIFSPKLIGTASEGGANVFKLGYFDRHAFLAQSPQFYKQMAIAAGMERVFEVGPVFRAENSFTHRHLTEFVGLDLEMAFNEHYHEVMLLIAEMLVFIFKEIPKRFSRELAIVRQQYPVEDFRFADKPLILTYAAAIDLLRSAGVEIGDMEDMSTEKERLLGRLVRERYNTDFYIVDKFPLALRPFYTMPDPELPGYANAYDFFMRGEEVLSGAQRVHVADKLEARAASLGIDTAPMRDYIDSFRYGASPHAGCGLGLERVVMFFLGLKNIRMTSLFPRDPNRIAP